MKENYFDGGILDYIGYSILAALNSLLSFGIATSWAVGMIQNWKTKHTVVDGQRLYFDGTGAQLFGNWIKCFLLTIITFGIYGFWLNIKMEQWIVKHTHHV